MRDIEKYVPVGMTNKNVLCKVYKTSAQLSSLPPHRSIECVLVRARVSVWLDIIIKNCMSLCVVREEKAAAYIHKRDRCEQAAKWAEWR